MLGKIEQKFLLQKQLKKVKETEKLHLNIFCVFEENKPSRIWGLRPGPWSQSDWRRGSHSGTSLWGEERRDASSKRAVRSSV